MLLRQGGKAVQHFPSAKLQPKVVQRKVESGRSFRRDSMTLQAEVKCSGSRTGCDLHAERVTQAMHHAHNAHGHTGHAVPKDVLQEILERELSKRVLSRSSERTLTGGTRSCGRLVKRTREGESPGRTKGKSYGGGGVRGVHRESDGRQSGGSCVGLVSGREMTLSTVCSEESLQKRNPASQCNAHSHSHQVCPQVPLWKRLGYIFHQE